MDTSRGGLTSQQLCHLLLTACTKQHSLTERMSKRARREHDREHEHATGGDDGRQMQEVVIRHCASSAA